MGKLLIILLGVTAAVAVISAYSIKRKGSENDLSPTIARVIKEVSFNLFNEIYKTDTSRSHSVTGFPIVCFLVQILLHGGDRKKILNILHTKSTEEAKILVRSALDYILRDKIYLSHEFEALSNSSRPFTDDFINHFADICGGVTKSLGSDHASNPETCRINGCPSSRRPKNTAVEFISEANYVMNINHPNNPTGRTVVDYYLSDGTVLPLPGWYGIAYMWYARDLVAQYLKVIIDDNVHSMFIITADNPDDLPSVIENITAGRNFEKRMASLKPMCLKFKSVFGAASMVNNVIPNLRCLGIELNNLQNVINDSRVYLKSIIEKINISVAHMDHRPDINSPKCCNKPIEAEITINKPLFYVILKGDVPIFVGSFGGQMN